MDVMIERLRASLLSGLAQPAYYFPAARSGILQTHKALASALLTRSPLNGTEPGEVPRLSGVVVDFISNLLNVETRRYHPEVSKVARFLESEVGRGRIDIAANEPKFAFPQICYKSMGATYPLQRTSSMVSEIAPIVLFLKYLVNKGNLLIVEEPEAHLHPDSQRTVARAIVRLIRMGVRVLVTTHSDYFVQQISNFIRLNQSPEERARLRYTEQDCLAATEVGAYLFSFGRRATATTVQELEVTGQDGIPEDEFVRIAEAIYRESVRARGVSKQG